MACLPPLQPPACLLRAPSGGPARPAAAQPYRGKEASGTHASWCNRNRGQRCTCVPSAAAMHCRQGVRAVWTAWRSRRVLRAHARTAHQGPAPSQQAGVALRLPQDDGHRGRRHRSHLSDDDAALGAVQGGARGWAQVKGRRAVAPPGPGRAGAAAEPGPHRQPAGPAALRLGTPAPSTVRRSHTPDDVSGHQVVGQVEQRELGVVTPPLQRRHVRPVLHLLGGRVWVGLGRWWAGRAGRAGPFIEPTRVPAVRAAPACSGRCRPHTQPATTPAPTAPHPLTAASPAGSSSSLWVMESSCTRSWSLCASQHTSTAQGGRRWRRMHGWMDGRIRSRRRLDSGRAKRTGCHPLPSTLPATACAHPARAAPPP